MQYDKHIFQGLKQDNHPIRQESQYLWDAKNIRLTSRDGNTGFSITNEKGTKKILDLREKEEYIAHTVVGNWLVLFTAWNSLQGSIKPKPAIYVISRINLDSKIPERQILFRSRELHFGHIKAIPSYESVNIQKVYWTDSINQPRLINITYPELMMVNPEDYRGEYNIDTGEIDYNPEGIIDFTSLYSKEISTDDTSFIPFDFTPSMKLSESVTVERLNYNSMFPSGVVQYVFTYYNKYGQETNPFYVTPLLYVAHNDRGGNEESTCSVAFKITIGSEDNIINSIDKHFTHVRVYSIVRTSIDSVTTTKRVIDIPITEENPISFVDDNTLGDTVDPINILYLGGKPIKAGVLKSKDNVLFLGNIETNTGIIKDFEFMETFKDKIKSKRRDIETKCMFVTPRTIPFNSKSNLSQYALRSSDTSEFYNYKNQLSLNENTATFKSGEIYRLGFQLLDRNGVWTEPIFLCDKKMTLTPSVNDNSITLNSFKVQLLNSADMDYDEALFTTIGVDYDELIKLGYVKIRPIIAKPSISNRTILAQGIVCPTVFNIGSRKGNSPFSQSSWLFRPMIIDQSVTDTTLEGDIIDTTQDSVNKGAIVESRHFASVYNNKLRFNRGLEIQNNKFDTYNVSLRNYDEANNIFNLIVKESSMSDISLSNLERVYKSDSIGKEYINDVYNSDDFDSLFYVDRSILTFHSPDIEFDEALQVALNSGDYKIRLVGLAEFTTSSGDIDIQTATSSSGELAKGFIHKSTYSNQGFRHLVAGLYYNDEVHYRQDNTVKNSKVYFNWMVSMWQSQGSLTNDSTRADGSVMSSELKKKTISNILYASNNIWFHDPYLLDIEDSPSVFNSNEVELIKINDAKVPSKKINYYGNVDSLISSPLPIPYIVSENKGYGPLVNSGLNETIKNEAIKELRGQEHRLNNTLINNLYADALTLTETNETSTSINNESDRHHYNPVRIKYKSTPHAVFALKYFNDKFRSSLPLLPEEKQLKDSNKKKDSNEDSNEDYDKIKLFWLGDNPKHEGNLSETLQKIKKYENFGEEYQIDQDVLSKNAGYLYIAEIYRDDIDKDNVYGGVSDEALMSNVWIPAGKDLDIRNLKENENISIRWDWGDTWYQRYDCLKTYPFTEEDENKVVEIGSFMCETRVNIDGRTDNNRGQLSNLNIRPTNFNLINKVYSQSNSFFNYRIFDEDYYKSIKYYSRILWSKAKVPNSDVDLWANVTLANSLDLEGSLGRLNDIESYNDILVAFQDMGISQILFNSRVQVNTTDGVPIEIANNNRVDGYRIISSVIGCQNFKSVEESPAGLYFVDKNSDTLYLFNGQGLPLNISERLGNMYWFRDNHNNIINLYYDPKYKDLYAITDYDTLCFSESLGQFVSRFDYNNCSMVPYQGNLFTLADNPDGVFTLWKNFEGEYCNIFGEYRDFMISFISNDNPDRTKIFDTIEFKSDLYDNTIVDNPKIYSHEEIRPVDYIKVSNEYQETDLKELDKTMLKKRFRVWRTLIPRHKYTRQRIRNPWAKIELWGTKENRLSIIHDLTVKYTV